MVKLPIFTLFFRCFFITAIFTGNYYRSSSELPDFYWYLTKSDEVELHKVFDCYLSNIFIKR